MFNDCSFGRKEKLLLAIQRILSGIDKPTLISVFQEWMASFGLALKPKEEKFRDLDN
jgi:hypothetical protein